jgi:hypothetical protein
MERVNRVSWAGALQEKVQLMGDKSPKAAKKHASQKQAKTDRTDQKRRDDVAAKKAPIKK